MQQHSSSGRLKIERPQEQARRQELRHSINEDASMTRGTMRQQQQPLTTSTLSYFKTKKRAPAEKQTHNKKSQFLHANFHFVLRDKHKQPSTSSQTSLTTTTTPTIGDVVPSEAVATVSELLHSPDTAADWRDVVEVRYFTRTAPECPICLSEPVAAKIVKCGHVFCFPCLLHHVSFSNTGGRAAICPLCHETFLMSEVKSASSSSSSFPSGCECSPSASPAPFSSTSPQPPCDEMIEMTLMKRAQDTITVTPATLFDVGGRGQRLPHRSEPFSSYSHFSVAKKQDQINILQRERSELLKAIEDSKLSSDEVIAMKMTASTAAPPPPLALLSSSTSEATITPEAAQAEELLWINQALEQVDSQLSKLQDNTTSTNQKQQHNFNPEAPSFTPSSSSSVVVVREDEPNVLFYQSTDGRMKFLHPTNLKMLIDQQQQHHTGLPTTIHATVLETLDLVQDEKTRQRYRHTSYLPLTANFSLVELDMSDLVSPEVMQSHADELTRRQVKRDNDRREREETNRRIQETPLAGFSPQFSEQDFAPLVASNRPPTPPLVPEIVAPAVKAKKVPAGQSFAAVAKQARDKERMDADPCRGLPVGNDKNLFPSLGGGEESPAPPPPPSLNVSWAQALSRVQTTPTTEDSNTATTPLEEQLQNQSAGKKGKKGRKAKPIMIFSNSSSHSLF